MQTLTSILLVFLLLWLIWEIWQKQSLAYLIAKKGIQISDEEILECLIAVLKKLFRRR